jgi:polyisoprenoid-binding protein YceI
MNAAQTALDNNSSQNASASPEPVTWQIDPAHASVNFSVRHMMVANVRGEFGKVSGVVTMGPNDPAGTSIEAVIDASSIQTREAARDQHLRSADFLDVARFPVITFKSRNAAGSASSGFTVTGDLTIHGVTREVVMEVEPLSPAVRDPYGNIRVGTSAAAKINRRDFGLTWNAVLETGGALVGNEIKISLDIELIKTAGGGSGAN